MFPELEFFDPERMELSIDHTKRNGNEEHCEAGFGFAGV